MASKQTKISTFFLARPASPATTEQSSLVDDTKEPLDSRTQPGSTSNSSPLEGQLSESSSHPSAPSSTNSTAIAPLPDPGPENATASALPQAPVTPVQFPAGGHDHTTVNVSSKSTALTQFAIRPVTHDTLPAFKRLVSTLLPINYPPTFFSAILPDSDLARVAVWTQQGRQGSSGELTVVGGIRCRLEPVEGGVSDSGTSPGRSGTPASGTPADLEAQGSDAGRAQSQLYIQTVGVLAPYRGHGIAAALLRNVLREAAEEHAAENVVAVYAHVWEANEDALQWYRKRGFVVGQLVEGYYRKLRPRGAWVVRRSLRETERPSSR